MQNEIEWITVGDLGEGFAPKSYILDESGKLNGKELSFNFENGKETKYTFENNKVTWRDESSNAFSSTCRITTLRENYYLVDFIQCESGKYISKSFVIDFSTFSFLAVLGSMPSKDLIDESLYSKGLEGKSLTSVKAEILHGAIDKPWSGSCFKHKKTNELIGYRNRYKYSETEVYEHIYLNEDYYSWNCLKGVEKGLCDTDRCHYHKIADELYLFIWKEKVIPTLGVVVIDMKQHRSDGKICGYADERFDKLSNFPVASYCDVLSFTNY